jgi:hypothetical protein
MSAFQSTPHFAVGADGNPPILCGNPPLLCANPPVLHVTLPILCANLLVLRGRPR